MKWLEDHEVLREEKLNKGIERYKSGWCHEIRSTKVGETTLMKTEVTRSQAITHLPHECWIACTRDGSIVAAFCSCVAGLSETCNHVTALACRVAESVARGLNVGTAHLQQWSIPSASVDVDTTKTAEEVLAGRQRLRYDPKKKKATKGKHPMFSEKRANFQPISPPPDVSQQQKYRELLTRTAPECMLAKMTKALQEIDLSAPRPQPPPRPPPPKRLKTIQDLGSIYFARKEEATVEDFMENFLPDYFQNLEPNLCGMIEERTKQQKASFVWKQQRLCRITGTKVFPVLRRQRRIRTEENGKFIDNSALLKGLTTLTPESHAASLKWGIQNEKNARHDFIELEGPKHKNFRFWEAGLKVDLDRPYLAATPDGFVDCSCCGPGLVEFKCPYSVRYQDPNSADTRKKLSYVTDTGLKTWHERGYFQQVQSQMAVTGRQYCYFYVWTAVKRPTDPTPVEENEERGYPLLRRIDFDEDYWSDEVLPDLDEFWKNYVAPLVIFGHEYIPVGQKTNKRKSTKPKVAK